MEEAVLGDGISFSYDKKSSHNVLCDVSLSIKKGCFIAVLGANGSGKSTLMKHFNALLPLQNGMLRVLDMDVRDEKNIHALRRLCGMVFQDPDNQFVSSVVGEDVAFGLENYGEKEEDIPIKVERALELVGMPGFEKRNINMLSGGQKQRIALAGVLAMNPEILIFDEAVSMLDQEGRDEILSYVKRLHEEKKTIFWVTHHVSDAIDADLIILMKNGTILKTGRPDEVLSDIGLLNEAGLDAPISVRIYHDLLKRGVDIGKCPLDVPSLAEAICNLK